MTEIEVISTFRKFLDNSSAPPHGHVDIQADGERHRYHVEGDRAGTKNGCYCLYTDGLPAGWCMSWKNGKEEKEIWKYELTDDEKKAYAQRQNNPVLKAQNEAERLERERRKTEALKLQREKQEQARAKALAEYNNAWPLTDPLLGHAYTRNKFDGLDLTYRDDDQFRLCRPKIASVGVDGGICKAGELLIPTRNISTGEFNSLIRIPSKPDAEGHWPKLNYTGISPKGSAYIIRPQHAKTGVVYVCEGVATAFAVMIDLRCEFVILAAGSCGNLLPVCTALKQRTPKLKVIIIADNDDAGIKAAQACVNAGVADTYIKSDINGFDWCDDLVDRAKAMKGALTDVRE